MENRTYGKVILAILALCIIAGAIILAKPMIDRAAAGIIPGADKAPGLAIDNPPWNFSQDPGLLSVSAAIDLSLSNEATAAWTSAHSGWGLSQARADNMDAHGKAFEWTLTYVDGRDVLQVNVQDGRVASSNTYTSSASVVLGMRPEGLVDSPAVMDNLAASFPGVAVNEGSMPFSMDLRPGSSPAYMIHYSGSGSVPGFTAVFDARTGELLESTYRSAST